MPSDQVPAAVEGIDWDRQIVIDATNDSAADDLEGRTSSEIVAGLVAGARVVKAANTLGTGGEMQQIHHPLAGVNLIRLGGGRVDGRQHRSQPG